MKINVEDKLYIENDSLQFILKQYTGKTTTNNKGEEMELYKVLGYFTTMKQVFKFLLKKKLMESTATTIQELHADLKRIENELDEIIKV